MNERSERALMVEFAMIGVIAAIGAYALTGQIIPEYGEPNCLTKQ